ncbi:hypothetical protein TTX_1716 [Thermoproteus tenax Kra 1]|uniref:Uncharacterized protein n=1 Tax=Thermoproteus tenax (strain ATCC 35583 / DSM 2078 / JCM 9277 / NBRC 100435 / Kra 1) TaxID=768679 RepID=G4RL92_THETK|nr:hypothetical protein TTX_1716 [Thermoproteus tenax Kra 1]
MRASIKHLSIIWSAKAPPATEACNPDYITVIKDTMYILMLVKRSDAPRGEE